MTNLQRPPLGMVGRFFFSPTDPTTLGFIRIIAGLLILYTHCVYSFGLQSFVGPHAWYDHEVSNTSRREQPVVPFSLTWEPVQPTIQLDFSAARREAITEFFRRLPESTEAREQHLRFLRTAFQYSPTYFQRGYDRSSPNALENVLYLTFKYAALTDGEKARVEEAIGKPQMDLSNSPITTFPDYFIGMTPVERKIFWSDLGLFSNLLPSDTDHQVYVRTWLLYVPKEKQSDLLDYLTGKKKVNGKDRSLPAEPTLRGEYLAYLKNWGFDPRDMKGHGIPIFSVWLHLTDPMAMALVHGIVIVIMVFFTLGLYTRTTSVLTWLAALNYIHRGQVYLFGQDTMQTILLFYLMIGPSGAALSLDALRARYRASRTTLAGNKAAWADAILAGPQPSWMANFVIRMLQIHFCFIYGSSGLSKLKGNSWWSHTAAWQTLINPEFGMIRYRWFESLIESIVDYKLAAMAIASSIVIFTLFLEVGWMFLIWTRLRPFMVIGSMLLHAGITLFMGLTMFGLYMFTLVSCYFPAALIRQRVCWPVGAGTKLTLHYDRRSPSAVKKAALVRAFDISQQVTYVDTSTSNKEGETHIITLDSSTGDPHTGQALFALALRELVLLRNVRWLGQVPGVWSVISWYGNK